MAVVQGGEQTLLYPIYMYVYNYMHTVALNIDIRDYIHKRDWKLLTWAIYYVRVLRVIVCISTSLACNGAKKWQSSDNSKTKTASRFCQAYSSGGVSALDVENEVGVPKLVARVPQSRRSQNGRFWVIFVAWLLTEDGTANKNRIFQCARTEVLLLPPFCCCSCCEARDKVPQKSFPLYCTEDDGANKRLKFVVMIIRPQVVRRLWNLLIAFLYPRAFNRLLYDATTSM